MAQGLKLNVCHLYPDIMDTYGDTGNIVAIKNRCNKRKIDVDVKNISIGDNFKQDEYDLIFFGGGQDKGQEIVTQDLAKKAESIKKSIENGVVLLSICGGYQLLQKYFETKDGKKLEGVGIFDAYTKGSDDRMIQNLLIEINPNLDVGGKSKNLIGFENHSGKTYLSNTTQPLGKVIKGAGNNGQDKTEGAVYKNAFGCYLHGSLLPKNPHFADFLIGKALERRYGKIKLKNLDDEIEWQAHKQATQNARSQS